MIHGRLKRNGEGYERFRALFEQLECGQAMTFESQTAIITPQKEAK